MGYGNLLEIIIFKPRLKMEEHVRGMRKRQGRAF